MLLFHTFTVCGQKIWTQTTRVILYHVPNNDWIQICSVVDCWDRVIQQDTLLIAELLTTK